MSLSIGIVGLPNAGKSTLFSALTKKQVNIANYPFATIDPNVGIVEVLDERLEKLNILSYSEKIIPTAIEFVDIAGLVKGANKGEGLGNQFLHTIREVDAIVYVIRAFEDNNIHHVEATVDPVRDIEILRNELALKDLETMEGGLVKLKKEAKTGNKNIFRNIEIIEKLQDILNKEGHIFELLQNSNFKENDLTVIKELHLLTAKPALYLLNITNSDQALSKIEFSSLDILYMNIKEEFDSADLSDSERDELGLGKRKLKELIEESYNLLNLITFFTTGAKETRAWTIIEGMKAQKAAGVIHTDFEEKFIRAEVIKWDKLIELGGYSNARKSGDLRTEGKEYIVKDGDVMIILHG